MYCTTPTGKLRAHTFTYELIPSLLSCLDTGRKSTPIPAGMPVLEGFGICSATQNQRIQYHENCLVSVLNIYLEVREYSCVHKHDVV